MDRAPTGSADRRAGDRPSTMRRSVDGHNRREGSGGLPRTPLRALPGIAHPAASSPFAQHRRPTSEGSPHNLPHALTSFIGREHELAEVRRLLAATRLLTLTGTGGVGKTRLAQEVASSLLDEFPAGVWLVELSALRDATLVPQAVATTLGVHEAAKRSQTDALSDLLASGRLLLVLDNCEHLIDACAALTDSLLRACPNLHILVTSREVLGIDGETAFRVPPLPLSAGRETPPGPFSDQEAAPSALAERGDAPPTADPVAATSDAVRLFMERAQSAVPTFTLTDRNVSAVEQICRRLDGIPLAIELAAARVLVLSTEQIAARLGDRFRLLSGGSRTALPRYRTLRALVDWSHDLLDERERVLLRRLAVFAGGWTLEAAESVCAAEGLQHGEILDLLSGLVAKSLAVTDEPASEVRYRFLESLREYAAEKLRDAGEEATLRERHLAWCLALAERAQPELVGPQQAEWLRRLDGEHDNLRAALAWSVGSGDTNTGLRLAVALYQFWLTRGFVSEGRRWLSAHISRSDAQAAFPPHASVRARALQAAGRLAINLGDYHGAKDLLTESVSVARAFDDREGLAAGAFGLGYLDRVRGDLLAARAGLEVALELFQELGDPQGIADTLVCLGVAAHFQEDPTAAHSLYTRSLTAYRALGNQKGVAIALNDLGELALEQGEPATARRLQEESLLLASELGDRERIAYAVAALGGVAAVQGEPARALRLAGAATAIRESIGEAVSDAWRARFERWLEPARQALTEEATATAWAEGEAIPLEQAVADALSPTESSEPLSPLPELPVAGGTVTTLTRREREVAVLVARGFTNRQIATELVIAEGTAANHVKHILARLGVDSRVQVAAWAVEHGLHPPSSA
jgi:predicted ATPase/DNA-binding CsgD family transcriptional regulator